jgi:hypothetical protein
MQGGINWILPKEINANRFFWNSRWLETWKNHLCPSMGPNGGMDSVAMDSVLRNVDLFSRGMRIFGLVFCATPGGICAGCNLGPFRRHPPHGSRITQDFHACLTHISSTPPTLATSHLSSLHPYELVLS